MSPNTKNKYSAEEVISFIMKFGAHLHIYGTPAHRLENALELLANTFDLRGQFFATPTSIMASFETGEGEKPAIVRVKPGGVELEKICLLDKLADDLKEKNISFQEAQAKLNEIIEIKNPYNFILRLAAYTLVSACASIFLGGGIAELLISSTLGLTVGSISELAQKNDSIDRFFEFIAAFTSAAMAALIFKAYPGFSIQLVILASLIVLVPGLSITVAATELATNNLVAGTARMVGAIVMLFKMGFGVALGDQLSKMLISNLKNIEPLAPFPENFSFIALALAPLAFTVLFKAHYRETIWILLAGITGYLSAKFGSVIFGANLGAFLGGLSVGLASNIYARGFNKPAATIMLPGILLLVPGSVGFRGLAFLMQKNTILGIDTAFDMFITATALVAGLMLASILVAPRKSL